VAVVRPDALRLVAPGGAAAGDAAGGAAGVVEAVRHRARQTTVAVRVEREGHAPAVVEVAAAPAAVPPVGARVAVAVDAGAVPVFPGA
jgi:hypothetical protein